MPAGPILLKGGAIIIFCCNVPALFAIVLLTPYIFRTKMDV